MGRPRALARQLIPAVSGRLNCILLENGEMSNSALPRTPESKGADRRSNLFLRLFSATSRAEIIIGRVLLTDRLEVTVIAFVLDACEASE